MEKNKVYRTQLCIHNDIGWMTRDDIMPYLEEYLRKGEKGDLVCETDNYFKACDACDNNTGCVAEEGGEILLVDCAWIETEDGRIMHKVCGEFVEGGDYYD